MDREHELLRAKWLLISAFLFLISACISWDEVIYLTTGRDAEAQVVRAYETSEPGKYRSIKRPVIDYTFTEPDGNVRSGTSRLSQGDAFREGDTVQIRYIPGENGSSRLAGRVHWLGVGFFALSVVVMVVFVVSLLREANEDIQKPKRRRKRPKREQGA